MPAPTLTAQLLNGFAAGLLLISFSMLSQRRTRRLIELFAWQGAILFVSTSLVAHSAGVLTTVHWAQQHDLPIHGALLATPPDLARPLGAQYPSLTELKDSGWLPIPLARLRFPSIVAASTNDALGDFERVRELADAWGSHFIDVGPVGHLNPASGFQSVQFRELEFVLGMKSPEVCNRLACEPFEMARLRRRLEGRTVSDAYDALLVRRGLAPSSATERADAAAATKEEDWRLAALLKLYEGQAHGDLLALSEVLVDIDENLSLWRAHHVQMVERMIGVKRGTGGSDGVGYLRSTLPKRAFPDLWRVRSRLGQEP